MLLTIRDFFFPLELVKSAISCDLKHTFPKYAVEVFLNDGALEHPSRWLIPGADADAGRMLVLRADGKLYV